MSRNTGEVLSPKMEPACTAVTYFHCFFAFLSLCFVSVLVPLKTISGLLRSSGEYNIMHLIFNA
jgi:hypothetical protein